MDNYIFTPENGVIIPDTSDIKSDVQSEYTSAFADLGTLSLEDATPQGRLIDLETNARTSVITYNANVANVLINITQSKGSALDAWGANFDIPRNGETYSSTPVTVTGVANTIIPQNSEALDVNGIIWKAENEIIIGSNGTATGVFVCSVQGAIALSTGQLNKIVASSTIGVDGWETIINTANATLGSEREGDEAYKIRLLQGIFNGSALFGNYASTVSKVDGVRDVYCYDNPYSVSLLLDDITIPAHSVYVCVDGGDSQDVAYALYTVKSAGAGWAGSTTVSVTDETYGTINSVSFEEAQAENLIISILITDYSNSNVNIQSAAKEVILNYFNNYYEYLGYSKVGIRPIIDPFVLASLLQSQLSGVSINSVEIGLKTPANKATASIIKGSVTSGIIWASVNAATFATEVSSENGRYIFTYDGSSWKLNGSTVDLDDYGITITGTPVQDDKAVILYNNGSLSQTPLQLYADEIAAIDENDITVTING